MGYRTNTNRRRIGSGADDAWAVIGASLTELSRGLADQSERSRIRQRQDAQDEETRRTRQRQEERDQKTDARLERAEARAVHGEAARDLGDLRDGYGGGVDIDPSDAILGEELARRAGRPSGIELVARPNAGTGAGDYLTSAILDLPTQFQFRRNPAERAAVAKADEAAAAEQRARAALEAARPGMTPAAQATFDLGMATGRMPTPQDSHFTPDPAAAAEAEARDFEKWKQRQDYSDRQLRAREASREGSRIKSLDNPKLPAGVMDYVAGKLVEKYGADRDAAAAELFERALPKLREAHPRLDVALLRRQFDAVFPKPVRGNGGVAAVMSALQDGQAVDPASGGRAAPADAGAPALRQATTLRPGMRPAAAGVDVAGAGEPNAPAPRGRSPIKGLAPATATAPGRQAPAPDPARAQLRTALAAAIAAGDVPQVEAIKAQIRTLRMAGASAGAP